MASKRCYADLFLMVLAALFLSCCAIDRPTTDFKRLESYRFDPDTDLADRLADVPEQLLESLQKLDQREDYLPYRLSPVERKQFASTLKELPGIHLAAMQKRLVGIYFVKNLSSGGYSDFVWSRDGKLYTLLVLNPELLKKSISEWVRDKEMSAFLDDRKDIGLNVNCYENGRSALLYLLLHESAHLLDYVAGCTPYVERELADRGKTLATVPFASRVWQDYSSPQPLFDFPQRAEMHFYGSDNSRKLSRGKLPEAYQSLAKTPFNILYASQNWAEDFAETAAFSSLARITGHACTIRIDKTGGSSFLFSMLDRPPVVARMPSLYSSCRSDY